MKIIEFPAFRSRLNFNILYFLLIFWSCSSQPNNEIHVSKSGDDSNNGALSSPFLTISKAADIATPGDIIIIHEGTYREFINPNKGGISENERITFKAATGENVLIKGSETINNWIKKDNYWEVVLPATFFNDYNPYVLNVDGDFQNYGQWHHRGDVYINNSVLNEVKTINQVESESYNWHTSTSGNETTINKDFNQLARTSANQKIGPLENLIPKKHTIQIYTKILPAFRIE